jgi:hypothetical protein
MKNRLCSFCGESLDNGRLVTYEQGGHHQQCVDDYNQGWNERNEELRMRAATGVDPRVHVQIALDLLDMQN